MRYKCPTCGIDFDDIEQFAAHKKQHQGGTPADAPGVTCLGCGKSIPIDASKANYNGPLTCPSCKQVTRVVLENGQVVTARFG